MPNLPISGLPQANALTGSELFATVQDGVTKYTTLNEITGSIGGVGGGGFGWARYDDTVYTTSSFFIVSGSTSEPLPNNAGNIIDTYMNSSTAFYNSGSQKVQMAKSGDVYSMVVVFNAKAPNANQTHIDISLSSTGATPYDRVSKSLNFAKGNDTWENFYESFHFYADDDFVTNGNQWTVTSDGGDVHFANIIYFIQKTFGA